MVDWRSINEKLILNEDKYVKYNNFKIFCGTYNVNGKSPDEFLSPWLCIDEDIDIYAVGFQEIVDLTTTSLLLKTDWAEKEQNWTDYVTNELSKNRKPGKRYVLINKIRMFGLYLMVLVSEKLYSKEVISEVYSSYVATGIFGNVGNKGSVGVSVKIHESRICFVCSHFASDTDKLEKRNADYRSTNQYLKFQLANGASDNEASNGGYIELDQHDLIFWFGDLNYRLDSISLSECLTLIGTSQFDDLLKYDQLSNERIKRRVFEYYNEGSISFRPTYKYLIKSDIYEKQQQLLDQQTSDNGDNSSLTEASSSTTKVKLPSWTDRVLWKSQSGLNVSLLKYLCINTITISDHKPVCALFDAHVKQIDQKLYEKLIQDLMKESDKKFNEEMPHISIDNYEFKFEDVMYYDRKRMNMIVTNEGLTKSNVDVIFYDANKKDKVDEDDDSNYNKTAHMPIHRRVSKAHQQSQWVNIFPQHKERVESGSKFTIEITTNFNTNVLPRLNKTRLIEDFLIVRCLNGNDSFATISCNYKPTIIGISLKALSSLVDESFENCDQANLIDKLENEIDEQEQKITRMVVSSFRSLTISTQRENVEKLLSSNKPLSSLSSSSTSISSINTRSSSKIATSIDHVPTLPHSMIEIYKKTFDHLKEDLVDKDPYFDKDLSAEYSFLMEHLIEKCSKILENGLSAADDLNTSNQSALTIEEQKNLVIFYLSSRAFDDFKKANFDMELLAECLNDLLNALPHPLIPKRFYDFCTYTDNCYEEAKYLFTYLPRSHCKLFEMIVKFLQIYLKCLSTADTNFHNILADAIFQIRSEKTNNESFNKFLKVFIDNHINYMFITMSN